MLPLSIGDGELCATALTTVSVPEFFRYWLQSGRISVGFLGAAQIDRFANLNTTVIGPYDRPTVRLPGAGGAPEMAAACQRIFIVMPQSRRAFVERLDFLTSLGHGDGGGHRARLGLTTAGPAKVITDLCVMEPDDRTQRADGDEPAPGSRATQVAGGDRLARAFRGRSGRDAPPEPRELEVLRELRARTAEAHGAT